ncbi:recombinase RecT [Ileibacterium valens]|uniref:recombinase RecT n=1 Tax=Ileibacterium valens TaxID=1862668 RepID=UPI0035187E26
METPKNRGITAKKPNPPKTVKDYLKVYTSEIARALPTQIRPEKFQRICMTALTQNPQLASCTPQSFIGAVLNAAQLGLEPNTPLGQAYLIPYAGKCTFQLGYRGLIELARRSGEISVIKAQTVYENDDFHYELGLHQDLHHIPAVGDRGAPIAYYAFYKTKDGDFDFEVAYRPEIEAHRQKYSKAKNSPWNTEFDAMAKKTLIKKVLKLGPLSTEIMAKINQDETVKSFNKDDSDGMKDLTLVPDESVIEAEYEETQTDPATGEVIEHA